MRRTAAGLFTGGACSPRRGCRLLRVAGGKRTGSPLPSSGRRACNPGAPGRPGPIPRQQRSPLAHARDPVLVCCRRGRLSRGRRRRPGRSGPFPVARTRTVAVVGPAWRVNLVSASWTIRNPAASTLNGSGRTGPSVSVWDSEPGGCRLCHQVIQPVQGRGEETAGWLVFPCRSTLSTDRSSARASLLACLIAEKEPRACSKEFLAQVQGDPGLHIDQGQVAADGVAEARGRCAAVPH